MKQKELMAPLYLKGGYAGRSAQDCTQQKGEDALRLASALADEGADAILIFDLSEGDAEHDASIGRIREIAGGVDLPLFGGGAIRRMEDVKKLIYAGCGRVFLDYAREDNRALTEEVSKRFGREKIFACVQTETELEAARERAEWLGGLVSMGTEVEESAFDTVFADCPDRSSAQKLLGRETVAGVFGADLVRPDGSAVEWKMEMKRAGIPFDVFEASVSWEELRPNSDGLLPVVVQDYRTQEVLMVAYMNREAYETTVRSGRMTYFSRSRRELWIKGLTSGHFQYVKELRIDCDNDTLLAKVAQTGAACHTGNKSCFYRTILGRDCDAANPLRVFEDVFAVIRDRKLHPKEGSYTNYLFDKGIDKILKKVGEEATEIVIAAKNPDPEEIKYEISDFLYHVMVLMVQKGVTWEEITEELARR